MVSARHFEFLTLALLDFRLRGAFGFFGAAVVQFRLQKAIQNSLTPFPHASCFTAHASPNHFIRPRQHVGWDRQADLLGGFKIDD